MNPEYVHRQMPERGCPCGWLLMERDDVRCDNPSTHWSDISGLTYCEEHTQRFIHGRLELIPLPEN